MCKLGDAAIWQSEPASWLPTTVGSCWLELTGKMVALPKLSQIVHHNNRNESYIREGGAAVRLRESSLLSDILTKSKKRHETTMTMTVQFPFYRKSCYLLTLAFMLHAPLFWGPSVVSNCKQRPKTHCWPMTRVLRSRVVQRCLQPLPVNEDNGILVKFRKGTG